MGLFLDSPPGRLQWLWRFSGVYAFVFQMFLDFFSCEHFLEGVAFTWWGLQTRVVHKVKKTSGLRNLWPEHVQFHWTWTWVCLKIVYPYTQWLMIIIPTKWLYLGMYPIFRHTHMPPASLNTSLPFWHHAGPGKQPGDWIDVIGWSFCGRCVFFGSHMGLKMGSMFQYTSNFTNFSS